MVESEQTSATPPKKDETPENERDQPEKMEVDTKESEEENKSKVDGEESEAKEKKDKVSLNQSLILNTKINQKEPYFNQFYSLLGRKGRTTPIGCSCSVSRRCCESETLGRC